MTTTEQKFTLSADTVIEWVGKIKPTGQLPLAIVGVLKFIEQLRGKRIELTVRVVDGDKKKTCPLRPSRDRSKGSTRRSCVDGFACAACTAPKRRDADQPS